MNMDKLKIEILDALTVALQGTGLKPEYITDIVWDVIVRYFNTLYGR